MTGDTPPALAEARTTGGGRVLVILLLAYIFNFIDRQIVGVLAVPIKAELGISDTQIGLMIGLAFALFYTGLGIPIAWLADRGSRVRIIAISLGLWSLFTALCGFTRNFPQLFLARMGVGVGEAGGVAPSYSLIADYFPPEQRARALAFFSFGIPIGSAIGLYLGGWIAQAVNWRSAFMVVGFAGLLIVPLVAFGIKEPVRGGHDSGASGVAPPPLRRTLALLLSKPSFWLLSLGAACSSIMGYGLFAWLPSLFVRSYKMSLIEASVFYGTIVLIGGVAGVWLGGWISDRAGRARPGAYALVPALAWAIAAPFILAGLSMPIRSAAFFLFLVPTALTLAWLGPVTAAIQHIVPPAMRSTASACFLFINNLIGIGFGVPFLGYVSDRMKAAHGADSLLYSISYGLGFYAIATILLLIASRTLKRDWYRGG
ncbi:MAG: transporter [Alphaproteobacteria bacterium]|nr:transporter [Alphaproteobacteria bacterium]